jgi:protein tyrosine/serine phosphatase
VSIEPERFEGVQLLGRLNVTKITDLRSHNETAARPDRLPAELLARRVHVPLDDVLARDRSQKANEADAAGAAFMKALESPDEKMKLASIDGLLVDYYYPRFARDGRAGYSRWLHGLLDGPADSAQIVHCTGGADRTGFAAALLLLILGVPKQQILEDFLLTNEFLFSPEGRALFKAKGITEMPPGYRLQARYLEASFKAMEEDYGTIDNYLRQGALTTRPGASCVLGILNDRKKSFTDENVLAATDRHPVSSPGRRRRDAAPVETLLTWHPPWSGHEPRRSHRRDLARRPSWAMPTTR